MWVNFDSLASSSRVWIYQANRTLSAAEESELMAVLQSFCDQWVTHGQPMKASARILYRLFIVVLADEDFRQSSGCSIDSSVRMLKDWQLSRQIDFFDRSKVAIEEHDHLAIYSLVELKKLLQTGQVTSKAITFNNLVPSKGTWQNQWRIPIEKSWLVKYLPDSALQSTP
jgi:hypothetical protein